MSVVYNERFNVFIFPDDEILKHCPQAQLLAGRYGVIPNDHELLQKLVKRGIDVPFPMANYEFPHGPGIRHPLAIQRSMANFLVLNPASLNLSEMRTGKTLAALWSADFIMRKEKTKCLIVAQLSTLKPVWGNNIFQHFLGKRTYAILHGSAERRSRELNRDVDFYIINYEGLCVGAKKTKHSVELARFSKELSERSDIGIAIVDEGSAYGDPHTKRFHVAQQILVPKKYLWMLTGTPALTAPSDAYGLAKLVNGAEGESFTSFKNRVELKVSTFKWVPKRNAAEDVAKILTPAIRFTQADAFDAPQCVTVNRDAELSVEQGKAWREMRRETMLILKDKTISAVNEAALRTKCIQIACGEIYDKEHHAHHIDNAPRMKVMKEIINEAPSKVIIFCHLTSVLKMIHSSLPSTASVFVDGSVTGEERYARLRAFDNDPRITHLVAHPGPIARGLDLTSAATIIWFCPTDNPEDYVQGNQRINGPTQKHKMTIVHIAATNLEREIYTRLEARESLQGSILKLIEDER